MLIFRLFRCFFKHYLQLQVCLGAAYVHHERAGSLYDLLTLRAAYGVSLYGEATEEFTWFPGYAWTLAYCRGCSAHLVRACCCDAA